MQRIWLIRLMTLLLWAAAAASVGYWGLRLFSNRGAGPVAAPVVREMAQSVDGDPAPLARLLGGAAEQPTGAQPAAASRYAVLGVISPARSARQHQAGVALISVDGKPARPYRVGQRVDDNYLVQSVERNAVALAADMRGEPGLTLPLPRPLPVSGNAAPPATRAAPPTGFGAPPAGIGTSPGGFGAPAAGIGSPPVGVGAGAPGAMPMVAPPGPTANPPPAVPQPQLISPRNQ